jgi:cytochrome c-type biogenesis protein CcmH
VRLTGSLVGLCPTKGPRGFLVPVLLGLVLLALPPMTLAAPPQTNIADVEDEVMCPICGTLLELAESPQAQRERALVKRLIAAGKSKEEIKDALVAQYGRQVLALPGGSGFDLSAYLVPAIAFLIAAVALSVGVRRWRRAADSSGSAAKPDGPQGEDAERLDADLARYDL